MGSLTPAVTVVVGPIPRGGPAISGRTGVVVPRDGFDFVVVVDRGSAVDKLVEVSVAA